MNRKELERLDADHPDWIELGPDELYARYWMYFADRVAFARGEVHWRRIQKIIFDALTPINDALTKFLNRFRRHA